MKVVFISNFYNYHQETLSRKLFEETNGSFCFIQTCEMDDNRKKMGWSEKLPTYAFEFKLNAAKCREIINQSEVVIIGSADYSLVKERLKNGRLTFLYYERLHKKRYSVFRRIKDIPQFYYYFGRYKSLNCLCASAYTAYDFSKNYSLIGRCYKWGYFPEVKHHDLNLLIEKKIPHSIIWVGRFIDWKHPEECIKLAKKLLKDHIYDFTIYMIGDGEMLEQIKNQINFDQLENNVFTLGSMTPDEVRRRMNDSEIFIFTSDRNEGWGVVLNEAMNSGCAVVASNEIGSVPYLINDGTNGLIYQDGNFEDLYQKVKFLLFNKYKRESIGREAYKTIIEKWNAEIASNRLMTLIDDIQNNGECNRFNEGPCSKAEIIKDGWYK